MTFTNGYWHGLETGRDGSQLNRSKYIGCHGLFFIIVVFRLESM